MHPYGPGLWFRRNGRADGHTVVIAIPEEKQARRCSYSISSKKSVDALSAQPDHLSMTGEWRHAISPETERIGASAILKMSTDELHAQEEEEDHDDQTGSGSAV